MSKYKDAPAVREIAQEIIREAHGHLASVHIEYSFVDGMPMHKGKMRLGRAILVTGMNAYLAWKAGGCKGERHDFFVIEIPELYWLDWPDDERVGVVDHELSHCDLHPDTNELMLVSHDLEEFIGVIGRRGLYRRDVEQFANIAAAKIRQLSLEDVIPDPEVGSVTFQGFNADGSSMGAPVVLRAREKVL